MKKYIAFLVVAILPFYYSCINDNVQPQPGSVTVTPGISAVNNGAEWKAVLLDTISHDSLELYAVSKTNILKIKFPDSISSTNELLGKKGSYYIRDNSGTITKTFKLDDTYINSVSVQLNSINKSITGGFNLRFVIDPSVAGTNTTGLDTVTFTNGYFIVPEN
jgi:hypothetical protein